MFDEIEAFEIRMQSKKKKRKTTEPEPKIKIIKIKHPKPEMVILSNGIREREPKRWTTEYKLKKTKHFDRIINQRHFKKVNKTKKIVKERMKSMQEDPEQSVELQPDFPLDWYNDLLLDEDNEENEYVADNDYYQHETIEYNYGKLYYDEFLQQGEPSDPVNAFNAPTLYPIENNVTVNNFQTPTKYFANRNLEFDMNLLHNSNFYIQF